MGVVTGDVEDTVVVGVTVATVVEGSGVLEGVVIGEVVVTGMAVVALVVIGVVEIIVVGLRVVEMVGVVIGVVVNDENRKNDKLDNPGN